jgi:hypothetical protein
MVRVVPGNDVLEITTKKGFLAIVLIEVIASQKLSRAGAPFKSGVGTQTQ